MHELLQLLGSLSIGIGFAYFGAAMLGTLLLMLPIAVATFRVNEGEGYFRFRHARLKEFAECGVFNFTRRTRRVALLLLSILQCQTSLATYLLCVVVLLCCDISGFVRWPGHRARCC